jgi:hypothetical protein
MRIAGIARSVDAGARGSVVAGADADVGLEEGE